MCKSISEILPDISHSLRLHLLRGEVMTCADVQKTLLLAERRAGLARSPNSSNWSWQSPENIHRSRNLKEKETGCSC